MTEEPTDFLYPFIESEETDAGSLLDDLASSARGKAAESARLQRESLDEYGPGLTAAGIEMADRFLRGGRLYTLDSPSHSEIAPGAPRAGLIWRSGAADDVNNLRWASEIARGQSNPWGGYTSRRVSPARQKARRGQS